MGTCSISKATEQDHNLISSIGGVAVAESHKGSSSPEVMNEYLRRTYSNQAIREELSDINNIYHIIKYDGQPVGFSKIVLNATHPNLAGGNIAQLDRIYLDKQFHGLNLGRKLLDFNIELSKNNNQSGMWLYTWIGNARAIKFYLKAGFEIVGSHKYYVTETHYDESHQMLLTFVD